MVRVTSEIGRLREVLMHEPGPEVDLMVPSMMEELLFDDILFGNRAREEHRQFRRVLQLLGVRVLEAQELLEDTLREDEARRALLRSLEGELPEETIGLLRESRPRQLASILVGGLRRDEPLGSGVEVNDLFAVPPLPNWCFQRDPQVVIGEGVVIASMAAPARRRETLLARAIFGSHPALHGTQTLYDAAASSGPAEHLEGGDVVVLSRDVLLVGQSERTTRGGIEALASALARREGAPRWMIVVELPRRRAYMHLDTVLLPVDRDACLVYAPLVLGGGPGRASVHERDLHARDPLPRAVEEDLIAALARRGHDLRPIPCGGSDPVIQQREQWTDGANALAVAPGAVILYDRNMATAEELGRHGFRVVAAEDLLLGREEAALDDSHRVLVLLPSNEISRARGGPHCLTHPLVRDDPFGGSQ